MKRTLSGERITDLSFCMLKSGSSMVAEQGHVMREIYKMLPHHLPKIYYVGKTWYAMQTITESCGPPGYRVWDWKIAARSMGTYWVIPEKWIYRNAPEFDPIKLYEYIEEQGWLNQIYIPSMAILEYNYARMTPYLTHGDCTHENCVIEYSGPYKFIDWQAHRHPYIPGHRDVDYGKMLQSLIGWDEDSHDKRTVENAGEVRLLLKESPMASFWCSVHFMRIKKRAKEQWQKDLCDENIDYASWLSEKEEVA